LSVSPLFHSSVSKRAVISLLTEPILKELDKKPPI
jgi:hypothetical protein